MLHRRGKDARTPWRAEAGKQSTASLELSWEGSAARLRNFCYCTAAND